jgi:hypothetical protein
MDIEGEIMIHHLMDEEDVAYADVQEHLSILGCLRQCKPLRRRRLVHRMRFQVWEKDNQAHTKDRGS